MMDWVNESFKHGLKHTNGAILDFVTEKLR